MHVWSGEGRVGLVSASCSPKQSGFGLYDCAASPLCGSVRCAACVDEPVVLDLVDAREPHRRLLRAPGAGEPRRCSVQRRTS